MKVNIVVHSMFTKRDSSGNVYGVARFINCVNGKSVCVDMGWGSGDCNAIALAMKVLRYAGKDAYGFLNMRSDDIRKSYMPDCKYSEYTMTAEKLAKLLGFRKGKTA